MLATFALRRDAGLFALMLAAGCAILGVQIALQATLLIGMILAIYRPAAAGPGVIAGLLAAASLTAGSALMPVLAGLAAVAVAQWKEARPGATQRLHGIGVGLAVGFAAARGLSTAMAAALPL